MIWRITLLSNNVKVSRASPLIIASSYLTHLQNAKSSSVRGANRVSALPNELIIDILQFTRSADLISVSRISRQFRHLALVVYFRRLGILHYLDTSRTICLIGDIPDDAVHALCSTPMLQELDFICDVVYLTSHMAKLRHFLTHVSKIPSVRIRFHPERIEARETALGMSMAIAEFLAFASGYDCRNMIVESRESSRSDNDIDSGWFCMAIHNTLEGWSHAATQMAATNVRSIHLCNTLFSSPMLLKWCLSFSGNPSLTSLYLSNSRPKTPSHYHRFSPHITLPSLESLTLKGPRFM